MRTWSSTRQPPGPATFRERERAENFPVALSVLPHQLRADLRAVYRVVRSIDELGDSGPWRPHLAAWYTDSTVDEAGLHRAAELVEAIGGRSWATAEAARRMRQAELCLDTVELPPGPRAELLALGQFVIDREA